jgi:hypothetical protein
MVDLDPIEKERRKKEEQKQQRIRIAQDKDDIHYVMSDERGRRFVSKLLLRAGIHACSFSGQSNGTIFNEGARNEGLKLLYDIKTHTPGFYLTLIKEEMNEND